MHVSGAGAEREREREKEHACACEQGRCRERERERETQNPKLSAWSPTQGSIPRTVRSWPEPKSRVRHSSN